MGKGIARIIANLIIFLIVGTVIALLLADILLPSNHSLKTQKWDSGEWKLVGEFDMEGFNVTPLKEIATDEYQFVEVRVDYYETKVPAYFILEVFFCDDAELPATRMRLPATRGENVIVKCPIQKGERFQVLTQLFTEDGEYDKNLYCKLSFSYRLTND